MRQITSIDSIINCDNLQEANVVLLGIGYDRTASHLKGAVFGAEAILKSLHEDIEFFDRYSKTEPGYLYKIASRNLGNLNDLFPEDMVQKVADEYGKLLQYKAFPFLLGGEHSVSIGAFQAIAKKYNPKEITIFQIDAHPDLRNDDANANPDQSRPSQFAHACVMRRAHEMGFNIVQVGIRSYSKEEYNFFTNQKNITVFEWGIGKAPSIAEIIKSVKTEKVYLDIDVDGIDPAHMPATGTAVPGGLEWYFTLDLINYLIKERKVIAADIVEVAPRPNDVLTEYGAGQLCYNILSAVLNKNRI